MEINNEMGNMELTEHYKKSAKSVRGQDWGSTAMKI